MNWSDWKLVGVILLACLMGLLACLITYGAIKAENDAHNNGIKIGDIVCISFGLQEAKVIEVYYKAVYVRIPIKTGGYYERSFYNTEATLGRCK